jgi:hypothetical protein
MEPEDSLPCSQKPSTGPYPEPDRSSPHHPILSLSKIYFNIAHPSYVLVFLVVSFLLAFPPVSYMHSSSAEKDNVTLNTWERKFLRKMWANKRARDLENQN